MHRRLALHTLGLLPFHVYCTTHPGTHQDVMSSVPSRPRRLFMGLATNLNFDAASRTCPGSQSFSPHPPEPEGERERESTSSGTRSQGQRSSPYGGLARRTQYQMHSVATRARVTCARSTYYCTNAATYIVAPGTNFHMIDVPTSTTSVLGRPATQGTGQVFCSLCRQAKSRYPTSGSVPFRTVL